MIVQNNEKSIPFSEEWLLFQNENRVADHIRNEIKQCWLEARFVGIRGLDHPRILYLSEEQFQSMIKRSKHLLHAVDLKVNRLLSQLRNQIHYPIYLFNEQGILLQMVGNKHPRKFFDLIDVKDGLLAGFPFLGHTALSLSIKTKAAQSMTGAEHYYSAFHSFTTLAAPIFHPINRECIGILATHIEHTEPHQSHHALLITLAMAIEEYLRMEYSHANIFKIHEETTNLIDHYISVVSSDGRIVDCNTALRDFLPNQQLIGSLAIDMITNNFDHDIKTSPMYRALYYGEETSNYEIWTRVRGKRYCFLCDTKLIHDPFDPEFYWIIHMFKDITEKKKMELNVLQREKLVSLGTLAAGLAHEIRNPLTTAKGFIQFLSESSSDKEAFTLIQNELNRITQLVNQFVLLSKPDFPQMKALNVNTMLTDFATFIQPESLLTGVDVVTCLCSPETTIRADKNQLTQVFINLAQNAFVAMKNNGQLIIECDDSDPKVVEIRFCDNGSGISEQDLVKILDPFFTTNEEGTGLGLSICYQIIEAHNGELKIDSEEGVGTTVTLRLPRN